MGEHILDILNSLKPGKINIVVNEIGAFDNATQLGGTKTVDNVFLQSDHIPQTGGADKYRIKYLKYKAKYLKLLASNNES